MAEGDTSTQARCRVLGSGMVRVLRVTERALVGSLAWRVIWELAWARFSF